MRKKYQVPLPALNADMYRSTIMQRTFQFWTFYNPLDKTKYSCDFILVDKEILNITVLTSVSPSAVKGPYTDAADKKILVDLKVQGLIR